MNAQSLAVLRLLGAVPAEPDPVADTEASLDDVPSLPPARGFDGGARQSVPPRPPSHEQWLAALLQSRR
jgi:hypothetical protein